MIEDLIVSKSVTYRQFVISMCFKCKIFLQLTSVHVRDGGLILAVLWLFMLGLLAQSCFCLFPFPFLGDSL